MDSIEKYSIEKEFENIPFVEGLYQYVRIFEECTDLSLSRSLKEKLYGKLFKELSFLSEVTFQKELDDYVQGGGKSFEEFIERITTDLIFKYPVLNKLLIKKTENFFRYISKIFRCFEKDYKHIVRTFKIDDQLQDLRIVDIDPSLGDGHNGEGTALVTLSNGTKLIYKSRNVDITNSYNIFLDWINRKLDIDLKKFKIINRIDYGWLEFINYESVNSEEELREYYYKAGILLAVTLLLGSKDCHRENVIASGKNPVLIDHETIIQPFLFNDHSLSWDEQHKIVWFSVLESILIVNQNTGILPDCAGYGVKGNVQVSELDKKIINHNTIDSRRVTQFVVRDLIDKNLPLYGGKHEFVDNYKDYFIEGFSVTYDTFINSVEELRSCNSPLQGFKDMQIRYVWRPTFVYYKILKYMRSAEFMSNFEVYKLRLHELMAKAYKAEYMKEYMFVLDLEVKQMLNGDIPIFNLNSLSNFLEKESSLKTFKHNSVENINHRLNLLSSDHKKEQLEYISKWLVM